jgi:hypothetical protein
VRERTDRAMVLVLVGCGALNAVAACQTTEGWCAVIVSLSNSFTGASRNLFLLINHTGAFYEEVRKG